MTDYETQAKSEKFYEYFSKSFLFRQNSAWPMYADSKESAKAKIVAASAVAYAAAYEIPGDDLLRVAGSALLSSSTHAFAHFVPKNLRSQFPGLNLGTGRRKASDLGGNLVLSAEHLCRVLVYQPFTYGTTRLREMFPYISRAADYVENIFTYLEKGGNPGVYQKLLDMVIDKAIEQGEIIIGNS
jgi:hypothetical protein